MKYNISIIKIIVGGLLLLILSGCTDWLEVDPKNKILEDQVFENESNVQKSLNGIYLTMASEDVYGSELTGRTLELVAQRYYVAPAVESSQYSNIRMKYYMANHNYTVAIARDKMDKIWARSYSIILGINTFIKRLENTENPVVITQSKKEILLGEAYGLRAYVHLDLLRMFGPVYSTDSTGIAIPYRSEAAAGYSSRLSAIQVMDKIVTDINTSLVLLKNDPVISEGVMVDDLTPSQSSIDEFYRYRNRRMNYYAVQALKVRALMYRNDKTAAAKLAKSLINNEKLTAKFPWTKPDDIFDTDSEDYVLSSEVIFGIHSYNMYTYWNSYFNPGITDPAAIYATAVINLKSFFDVDGDLGQSPDVRAKFWAVWTPLVSNDGGEPRMISTKFTRSAKTTPVTYYQPLIRKSELFYALAETEQDVTYLDSVRINRSLKTVAEQKPTYNLDTEITNEYIREFTGEGQLFYYYKRRFFNSIVRGVPASSGIATISMTKAKYIFPIPQAELDK